MSSSSGQYTKVNQQTRSQVSFSATSTSQSQQAFTFSWSPSSAGDFVVMLGVFDGQWTNDYHWNGGALNVTVT